jgi:hypothetical protein
MVRATLIQPFKCLSANDDLYFDFSIFNVENCRLSKQNRNTHSPFITLVLEWDTVQMALNPKSLCHSSLFSVINLFANQ